MGMLEGGGVKEGRGRGGERGDSLVRIEILCIG